MTQSRHWGSNAMWLITSGVAGAPVVAQTKATAALVPDTGLAVRTGMGTGLPTGAPALPQSSAIAGTAAPLELLPVSGERPSQATRKIPMKVIRTRAAVAIWANAQLRP